MKRAPTSVLWALALCTSVYGQTPVTHAAGAYAQVNGAKLWYETEGQGEPLVLVAGGPGDSHSEFHPFFSRLAGRFRIIYFDALGVGRSDRAKSAKEYMFAREVEDLEGLCKALGLPQMNLLGHSLPPVSQAAAFG
jgi:proline iminopeptidase